MVSTLPLVLATALGMPQAPASALTSPAIGATVPKFSLKDIRRRPRAIDSFKDKKAFVVVFVGNECPLANLYLPTLIDHRTRSSGRPASNSWRTSNSRRSSDIPQHTWWAK